MENAFMNLLQTHPETRPFWLSSSLLSSLFIAQGAWAQVNSPAKVPDAKTTRQPIIEASTVPAAPLPKTIRLVQPVDNPPFLDLSDGLLVVWETLEQNEPLRFNYVVKYGEKGKKEKEIAAIPEENGTEVIPEGNQAPGEIRRMGALLPSDDLKPGKTYTWRVIASEKNGQPRRDEDGNPLYVLKGGIYKPLEENKAIAEGGPYSFTVSRDIFGRSKEKGFSLQRSFTLDQPDANKAKESATLAYINSNGESGSLQTRFALRYAPKNSMHSFSVETRLDSGKDQKSNNAIRLRLTRDKFWSVNRNSQVHSALSAKYEADEGFDSQKLMAEWLLTPDSRLIGRYFPGPREVVLGRATRYPAVQYRWRPYLGANLGRNLKVGDSEEKEGTILRLMGRLHNDIRIPFLARGDVNRLVFFADLYGYYLPLEDSQRLHSYIEIGGDYFFTDQISLALRYSIGKDAPAFEQSKNYSAGIGVHF